MFKSRPSPNPLQIKEKLNKIMKKIFSDGLKHLIDSSMLIHKTGHVKFFLYKAVTYLKTKYLAKIIYVNHK